MHTLDTNAVIYYLAKDTAVIERIDTAIRQSAVFYLSVVSVVELLRFGRLTVKDEFAIRSFLSLCSIINMDAVMADQAGAIGRTYGLKLADSIIAAAALFTGTTLLTRNVRDFKRVPHLSVEAI